MKAADGNTLHGYKIDRQSSKGLLFIRGKGGCIEEDNEADSCGKALANSISENIADQPLNEYHFNPRGIGSNNLPADEDTVSQDISDMIDHLSNEHGPENVYVYAHSMGCSYLASALAKRELLGKKNQCKAILDRPMKSLYAMVELHMGTCIATALNIAFWYAGWSLDTVGTLSSMKDLKNCVALYDPQDKTIPEKVSAVLPLGNEGILKVLQLESENPDEAHTRPLSQKDVKEIAKVLA